MQAQLNAFLSRHLKPNASLLLAFSGGLDSVVLLHLLVAARQNISLDLHAMHVHHGLSPYADAWADFCVRECALLDVPLAIAHVQIAKNNLAGLEATARKRRYEALQSYRIHAIKPDYILTAHHQNDQAETLLLRLFRGAGVKGMASMTAVDETSRLLRPLLNWPRADLLHYATQHGLKWCEDESNLNTDFDRNFVRHQVLPMLQGRYAGIVPVLARTAAHFAEANHLLDSLAAMDGDSLLFENSLCMQGLSKLDTPRAKNVLRWWLSNNQLEMPNATHLAELLHQLRSAQADANVHIVVKPLILKRYQQRAYLISPQVHQPYEMLWHGEPELTLPDGSTLYFKQVLGAGMALKWGITSLKITHRKGGERFKCDAARPTRTLKYHLQEIQIPPWQREYFPLVYWQDTLSYVPNVGAAHQLQAAKNEMGWAIFWQDNTQLSPALAA